MFISLKKSASNWPYFSGALRGYTILTATDEHLERLASVLSYTEKYADKAKEIKAIITPEWPAREAIKGFDENDRRTFRETKFSLQQLSSLTDNAKEVAHKPKKSQSR